VKEALLLYGFHQLQPGKTCHHLFSSLPFPRYYFPFYENVNEMPSTTDLKKKIKNKKK
jgi:hypothetical protein